ncbi:metallothionein-like protein 1 [Daucus carota subsp. sativus]|uniref:metallothionein-like protein 1 n=1 Tax=Daucus carota subsp. sativus TaxID=79200 RepID=UPI0007EF323A|nr:PREDICTED: metallothionein-like protein 1 [Daucus carota subsp. sativus]
MSSCGSNCNCGSDCKCGSNGGCSMHLDIENSSAATTIVVGVAPMKTTFDGAEKSFGEGGNTCKCGSNCTCDTCNC